MKLKLYIFFIILLNINSFCQDSIVTKNSWQIEGGNNSLIPISRSYTESYSFYNYIPSYSRGYFKVTHLLSSNNFFIDVAYLRFFKTYKKFQLGIKSSLGYKHYELKFERSGKTSFSEPPFIGTINTTTKYDNIFLNIALNCTFKIKKNIVLSYELGFLNNIQFNLLEKNNQTGYINDTIPHNYYWEYSGYGFIVDGYMITNRLNLNFHIFKKFAISLGCEIPLQNFIIYSDSGERGGETPYLTSVSNISFLNIGISIIYKIK